MHNIAEVLLNFSNIFTYRFQREHFKERVINGNRILMRFIDMYKKREKKTGPDIYSTSGRKRKRQRKERSEESETKEKNVRDYTVDKNSQMFLRQQRKSYRASLNNR